jgi:hypothetical protein
MKHFLKEYEKLKVTKNAVDALYFVDGCHSHQQCCNTLIRMDRETGTDKYLKTNSGRQRLNLNGTLYSENITDVEVLSKETLNADAMIRLCDQLLTKHTITIRVSYRK